MFLIGIISLSFFFYSSRFYPLLNSDDGISILMVRYFKWKTSLYFWGQDRYGSLVPLLGRGIYLLYHPSAIIAESISHYLVLAAGFFAVSSFLRSVIAKTALCLVWFFPPFHMLDMLHNTLGIEYSVLGIALYFLASSINSLDSTPSKRLVRYILALFFFILATWVSDLDIVSILLVFGLVMWFHFKRKGYNIRITILGIRPGYYIATGIALVAGIFFILYVKGISGRMENYQSINGIGPFKDSLGVLLKSLEDLLQFKSNEPGTSAGLYGMGLLIAVLLFVLRSVRIDEFNKGLILFFLLQTLLILLAVLASQWVSVNEVARRYFISVYAGSWVTVLLLLDQLIQHRINHYRKIAALAMGVVLVSGIGTLYNLSCIWPKSLLPAYVKLSEFKQFGNIGIIGNYWNSYVVASIDPDHIIATPHQNTYNRNTDFIPEVFAQDRLFVIRDGWFEHFPDTMFQYRRVLVRKGKEQVIGDCFACEYSVIKSRYPRAE